MEIADFIIILKENGATTSNSKKLTTKKDERKTIGKTNTKNVRREIPSNFKLWINFGPVDWTFWFL